MVTIADKVANITYLLIAEAPWAPHSRTSRPAALSGGADDFGRSIGEGGADGPRTSLGRFHSHCLRPPIRYRFRRFSRAARISRGTPAGRANRSF